ncbi:MAG: CCA tRNA nucleotidyltransferase, partial [Phycisphaerales bacterium]|nr:CCA tRNA nucleotidyltransferase [Hyphomonadaceae bacterium]
MITHAAWLKAKETQTLMTALDAARAGGSRFVGGCVRNTLMGREVDDIDIATQLTPDQVTDVAAKAGFTAHPTGIEHGTITVVVNHKPFEVTTLRRDVSTDGRRATVAFTESWEEDAERRDFRMNALYADAAGAIHDPTGGGLEDVRTGRVIFIGDAHTRIKEDYLRILRFFRFNAWYARGPVDPQGL